ncbi:MAG TPA: hypothetical protein VMY77_09110 [Chitinophagaceae bacterium]|nr:hypothetical protein [Chitinophagaceae bacterium]
MFSLRHLYVPGIHIGNAISQNALFAGAIVGGVNGVVSLTLLFAKLKIVHHDTIFPVIAWGTMCFGTASLFAVTNLNTPVIPFLSIMLVGLGCVTGNSFRLKKQQNKQFYTAVISFLLIIPALYFVIGCILKYEMGFSNSFTLLDWLVSSPSIVRVFNLVSPFVFIGGPVVSILLNISFKLKPNSEKPAVFSYALQLSKINLVVAFTGTLLLFILTLYLFVENL